MPAETHSPIASFIWSICNLLRGPYKQNEYRKVILPLPVIEADIKQLEVGIMKLLKEVTE